MDRNRVRPGSAAGVVPSVLLNLQDDRRGGLTPMGRWGRIVENVSSRPELVVGSDPTGLMSFRESIGTAAGRLRYGLYRGESGVEYGATYGTNVSPGNYGAHIPGVGAYRDMNHFMVQDRDGNTVEPFIYNGLRVEIGGGSSVEVHPIAEAGRFPEPMVGYDPLGGRWVAASVYGDRIAFAYRDSPFDEWILANNLPTVAGSRVSGIARSASHWVVVTTGGMTARSADGVVWSSSTQFSAQWYTVTADPGSSRFWRGGSVSGEGRIDASVDGGLTWQVRRYEAMPIAALEFNSARSRLLRVVPGPGQTPGDPTGGQYSLALFAVVGEDLEVIPWRGSTSTSTALYIGTASAPRPDGVHVASTSTDIIVTANYDAYGGAPHRSVIARVPWGEYGAEGTFVPFEYSAEGGPEVFIHDVAYVGGDNWVAVTDSGMLESASVGSWAPMSLELPAGFSASGVDSDGAGQVVAVGGGVSASWNFTPDANVGRHEYVALVSVLTQQGKLVVWDVTGSLTLSPGENMTIAAAALPGSPAYAGNVTIEVYTRFSPRVWDEDLGQWVIRETPAGSGLRHLATLSPGDDPITVVGAGVGRVIGLSGSLAIAGFASSDGEATVAAVNDRVWFRANRNRGTFFMVEGEVDLDRFADDRTVLFTELGYVNLVGGNGFLRLSSTQSGRVTGLLPSPSGLMVFFNNEVFVVTGDIDLQSLTSRLYPDSIGLDTGCRPALSGGVPLTIWQGKVWALSGSQAQDVSLPVWRQEEPFIDVAADPPNRALVCLTGSGGVYMFRVDSGFWSQVGFGVLASRIHMLMPHPAGVVYMERTAEGNWLVPSRVAVPDSAMPAAPVAEMALLGLDAGDPLRRDNWLNVRFTTEQPREAAAPVLYYRASDASSSVPGVFDKSAAYRVVGVRRGEEWWFKFPVALKSRRLDVLFVFQGFDTATVIEPGMEFTFVGGHVEGRRVN